MPNSNYPDGFQVGADGKRHALADLATVTDANKAEWVRVYGLTSDGAVPVWNAAKGRAEWQVSGGGTIVLHASAARSSSGTTTGVELGDRDSLRLNLAVTALTGTNEQQTVTVNGSPTGGTFTLTYSGQTTAGIAYNAAASVVQTALENLSNIAVGDVAVTGSAGGPYTVTFQGALGSQNVAQMTEAHGSLTGGTSPSVAVATITPGVTPTLDVAVQTAATSGGTYATVASFAQVSAIGTSHKVFDGLDDYVRISYTVSGGSLTFAVTGKAI